MKSKMLLILASFCLAVAGCIGKTSPPVSYYYLAPMEKHSIPTPSPETAAPLSVGVGPVSFPEVLDRPQIVTRTDLNRYRIDEFQRWGGSLQQEFSRVFSENLAALLNTENVAIFPWEKHFRPRYRIVLEILRFDGRLGESAILEARWTITDGGGRQSLRVGRSSLEKPVSSSRHADHVKGLGQTLEQFSAEIAAEIRRLEEGRPPT